MKRILPISMALAVVLAPCFANAQLLSPAGDGIDFYGPVMSDNNTVMGGYYIYYTASKKQEAVNKANEYCQYWRHVPAQVTDVTGKALSIQFECKK